MKSHSSSATAATTAAAAADSSMDDNVHLSPKSTATRQTTGPPSPDHVDGDPAVWAAFSQNFRQVQSVLDRNRVLIQQVNDNHQSKLPENLVKNVALIQEINGNISKVVSMYSNLSTNFTGNFQQHRDSGEK